jgi:hypothetical protein
MAEFVDADEQVEDQHHLQRDENVMKNSHAKISHGIIATKFNFTIVEALNCKSLN